MSEEYTNLMKVRRVCGLKNLGNTCYANSILQCLFSVGMLRQYLVNAYQNERELNILKINTKTKLAKEYRFKHRLPKTDKAVVYQADIDDNVTYSFLNALGKTFHAMEQENLDITPKLFKSTIGKKNEIFTGYQQHDSQELLGTILNELHDELGTTSKVAFTGMTEEVTKYYSRYVQLQKIYEETPDDETRNKVKEYIDDLHNENPKFFGLSKAYYYWKNFVEKSHSVVTDLFTGLYLSTITCDECGKISHGVESFNSVSLSLKEESNTYNNYGTTYHNTNLTPYGSSLSRKQKRHNARHNIPTIKQPLKNQSLDDLLKDFVNGEKLDGDNQYHCDKCGKKVNATKKIQIFSSPNVLIVQLKRFINRGNTAIKNNAVIDFPFDGFDLSPYMTDMIETKGSIYDLVGVSNHSGSCYGGHYIAHCKNDINNKWYKFNDDHPSPVSDDKIKDDTDNAYILFYVKRSSNYRAKTEIDAANVNTE